MSSPVICQYLPRMRHTESVEKAGSPTVNVGTGLREMKKMQQRTLLEDAAIEIFSEQGYATTPVDDVAGRLRISPRTVYRYFAFKEDLVLDAERRIHAEALTRMSESPQTEPPLVSLEHMIAYFEEVMVERRSRQLTFHRLVADTPELDSAYLSLMTRLENDVLAILGDRPGMSEIRAAGWSGPLLAAAFTTAHRIAVNNWINTDPEAWLPTIVRRNFALLTKSLEHVPGWPEIVRPD